jgi:hypothetical protein
LRFIYRPPLVDALVDQKPHLESVLEGWVLVGIADHTAIPDIDGNRLEIRDGA